MGNRTVTAYSLPVPAEPLKRVNFQNKLGPSAQAVPWPGSLWLLGTVYKVHSTNPTFKTRHSAPVRNRVLKVKHGCVVTLTRKGSIWSSKKENLTLIVKFSFVKAPV